MQICIIAVGTRLQPWVYEGFNLYQKRFPQHIELQLIEIPSGKRTAGGTATRAMKTESEQLIRRARDADRIIALDEGGRHLTTMEFADELRGWQQQCRRVALLVGGADGLHSCCKDGADGIWSLSRLTLPHAMVRVLLAEQLYRAWTVLQGHPYHRK